MKKLHAWIPAIAAPLLVVGAIATPPVANAGTKPADKTADQVLALVADAKDASYSGTVDQSSDLGLPDLPSNLGGQGADASGALELLTTDHKLRVFADGDSKQRIQVLDSLAERDVVRNGTDVWTYDSKAKIATHVTLPSKSDIASKVPDAATPATPTTPDALAKKFLAAIDPQTDVSVIDTATVAGRAAYQLVLDPTTADTLIDSVTLSVDAETGLPLKVVVAADGQKAPAFTVGYTSIDFSTPDAERFAFTPPKGTDVTENDLTAESSNPDAAKPDAGAHADRPKPTVVGEGWSTIAIMPAPSGDPAADGTAPSEGTQVFGKPADAAETAGLLDQLTTAVDGGRAVQTSLVSILFADDGRVLVGAVPVSALQAAAG